MTIRRLRASITRLVLIGAMAAAVAAGGVALGPQHEAAAYPKECGEVRSKFFFYLHQGDIFYYNSLYTQAIASYEMAQAMAEAYDALGC